MYGAAGELMILFNYAYELMMTIVLIYYDTVTGEF